MHSKTKLPLRITPQISRIIQNNENKKTAYADGVKKQFWPDAQELNKHTQDRTDPVGDHLYSPIPGIVHRHKDRCLLKPVYVCPVHCRFCFRKEQLGQKMLSEEELNNAFLYIKMHKEIWEVILTGGDPLILSADRISRIVNALSTSDTSHVEIIRIHTRVPVVDSKRITKSMIRALKNTHKTIYIALHANHPDEFTDEAIKAIQQIIDAGIPMISQTVLLKGVNNNIDILSRLMRLFVKHRIKPYYLHHPDLVEGTKHFRCSIKEGRALINALRRDFSGLCQPTYVLDIPGGYGKIPLNEDYTRICLKTSKKNSASSDFKTSKTSDKGSKLLISDLMGNTHCYQD